MVLSYEDSAGACVGCAYDGHENVRFLTNTAASATDSYDYDAFGMSIRTSGTTPNNYLYSGEQYDNSAGLYYLRARYYNQATGRFSVRDPEEGVLCSPLTSNPYIYAWEDPVDRIDPTGRDATEEEIAIDLTPILQGAALTGLAIEIICGFDTYGSGVQAVTQPDVLGGVQTVYRAGPCTLKSRRENPKPTCKTEFPKLIPVNQLPWFYQFANEDAAFLALQAEYGRTQLRKGASDWADKGPCSISQNQYAPGWHVNVLFSKGGSRAGSLVGCPACDDSGGAPKPTERWGII